MKIINFLYPKMCSNCSQPWEYLCAECKKKLTPHPEICPYCHTFNKFYQTCFTCKNKKNSHLEWLMIVFSYDKILKNLIYKVKYFHKKDIANFLAQRLYLLIQTNQLLQYQTQVLKKNIIISYVPSHRYRKYFVKWYNQSQIIAKKLASKIWRKFVDIIKKSKKTKAQALLNKDQRETNLTDSFEIRKNLTLKWDEIVIIVDDITTTWSTLNEIAKTITKKYPKIFVRWAVLWRNNK